MEIQRYKVGYYTDEWGMSSNTPCLIKSDTGYAVKYEDFAKSAVEIQTLREKLRVAEEALNNLTIHNSSELHVPVLTKYVIAGREALAKIRE